MKATCKFDFIEGRRIICKTHDQALLYAYFKNGEVALICQIGEDEIFSGERYVD